MCGSIQRPDEPGDTEAVHECCEVEDRAVRLEDKLYATAGLTGGNLGGPNVTECYDTKTNCWSKCEPAFSPQWNMHCAVVQRYIAWKNLQRSSTGVCGYYPVRLRRTLCCMYSSSSCYFFSISRTKSDMILYRCYNYYYYRYLS